MYGYRTRPVHPGNYHPRYSEDPRYLDDPRYYGGGGPGPYRGGPSSGKMNAGMIFGCALFMVFVVLALVGGLAVGLAFGLAGSSPDSAASTGNGGSTMTTVPVSSGPTLCSQNPCSNGGTCSPAGSNGFSCICPTGFTGVICQQTQNACSSSPCSNEGTCTPSGASGFVCSCPAGFTGTRCTETAPMGSLSATCPGDIVTTAAQGETSVVVTWDPPAVSNADGAPTITYSQNSGSSFNIGISSVVATVTDSSQTVQCDFQITVQDPAQLLTVTCPNDMSVSTDPGENFATPIYGSPQVSGSSGLLNIVYDPPRNSPLPVGSNTVEVTVTNSGQMARCTFRVTVSDEEGPVLTNCPSGGTVSTSPGEDFATITWMTPDAVDNTGGLLSVTVGRSPGRFGIGRHDITATATDSHGNQGICTWTYDVRDDEDPVINCPASFSARLPSGLQTVVLTYEDQITATDNVGTGLDVDITPSDIYPVGIGMHVVDAMATDASGNSASCSFTISISESCGSGSNTPSPRIIGGMEVGAGIYPWQVSLYEGTSHFCGGVIIDEDWVLTAAHCSPLISDNTQIIAGDVSLATASATRQTRSIAEIVMHPSYVDIAQEYDIALLRLNEPLTRTDYVLPVCLATENEEQGLYGSSNCWVAGWGTIDASVQEAVNILRAVQLPDILTASQCQPYHTVSEVSLCAGDLSGGRDACLGDSGGGLVCPDLNNRWHTIGLVSSGRDCALPNTAAIYTRVSQFLDFIYAYLGAELVVVDFDNTGTLTSPTAPGSSNYPNNVVKGWRYRRFGGRAIQLEFSRFDLASGDTLTLGHGLDPWDDSTQLRTMDSSFTAVILEVTQTDIWFRFQSSRSGVGGGFSIRVRVIN